jgi:UDP-2,3-diacylglucosamine pyrophosphatase LpxH
LDGIIDSAHGVPIGNYLSQYFGNLYLSGFDHWLKEEKHIKYYYRYCDDLVILHGDKSFLHDLLHEIQSYLVDNLKLRVKENWQVFPTRVRGIDFVGYRCFGDYTLLRKSTAIRMKRKMRVIQFKGTTTPHDQGVIASYEGWLLWCDSYRLHTKYIEPLGVI